MSPLVIIFGFGAGLYAITVFGLIANLTWLKIWLAPKLYLIEYAASLMKWPLQSSPAGGLDNGVRENLVLPCYKNPLMMTSHYMGGGYGISLF